MRDDGASNTFDQFPAGILITENLGGRIKLCNAMAHELLAPLAPRAQRGALIKRVAHDAAALFVGRSARGMRAPDGVGGGMGVAGRRVSGRVRCGATTSAVATVAQ